MHGLIVLLGMVTFVAVLVLLSIRREKLDYNHGICPRCESQGEFIEMRKAIDVQIQATEVVRKKRA